MKYIFFVLGFCSSMVGLSQSSDNVTSISIKHISGANHYIPRLYIMREVKDFRNSTWDSLCLLTDTNSFDKLKLFLLQNDTFKKRSKDSSYEYGSYEINLKKGVNTSLIYIISDNASSIDFFNRMREYIRINGLDDNLSKKIKKITPHSKESGLM